MVEGQRATLTEGRRRGEGMKGSEGHPDRRAEEGRRHERVRLTVNIDKRSRRIGG